MYTAIISTSTSGSNTIVSAISDKKIRLLSYTVVGATTVKWQSGSTDLSGAMNATYGLSVSSPADSMGDTIPLVETTKGEALNLNLGGSVAVGGHITYELRG